MPTIRRKLSNEERVKIIRFLPFHRRQTPDRFIQGEKRGSFSRSHHNRFIFARQKTTDPPDGLTINPLFFVQRERNLLLYASFDSSSLASLFSKCFMISDFKNRQLFP